MRFRFTLQYLDEFVEISPPDGWTGATLKLARDKDFHSLIEFFDGSFIFYGNNGEVNGGINNIKAWEQHGGPDSTILFFADFTYNEQNFYQIFAGQLDLSLSEELPDRKFRIPIIRDDFWAKFYNRKETPVNLQALTDLDGEAITPVDTIDLNLISQIILKTTLYKGFDAMGNWDLGATGDLTSSSKPPDTQTEEIILWSQVATVLDTAEIKDSFTLPTAFQDTEPTINLIEFLNESGEVRVRWRFRMALTVDLYYTPNETDSTKIRSVEIQTDLYYRLNNDAITFLEGENGIETFTPYSQTTGVQKQLTATIFQDFYLPFGLDIDVNPGDLFYFYAKHTITIIYEVGDDDPNSAAWGVKRITGFINSYQGESDPNYVRVEFDSLFRDTVAPGFFVHDSAAAITKGHGLGVDNPFYSEFFGGLLTTARQYQSDGCAWNHANLKGLQARGYTLTEKPYSMTFMQWWKGIYPIFNTCLFYDTIEGESDPGFTPDVLPDLDEWGISNTSSEPILWTGGIPVPVCDVNASVSAGALSDWFGPVGYTFEAGETYKFSYLISADGVFNPADYYDLKVRIVIGDLFFAILEEQNETQTVVGIGASFANTFEFVAPVGALRLAILLEFVDGVTGSGIAHIEVNSFTDETQSIPGSEGQQVPVIRVEDIETVYDRVPVVNISNIRQITRNYDTDKMYNKVEIGYSEWKAEAISGITDPQTKRTYATRFKKIGQAIQIFSDWIAGSTAIEETRRQSIEKSKDYKFDDKTLIIRLFGEGSSGGFDPAFDEEFSSVTNMPNSNRKYNLALSAGRNFLRFRNWFNGCLQSYLDSFYRWVDGEGNNDMTSQMDKSPDCMEEDFDGQSFAENQNIPVTDDIIHTTYHYEIECPLELIDYLRIRNNRKKAVGISLTESGHVPLFIEELGYQIMHGKCSLSGWTTEYLDLTVVEGPAPTQECFPSTDCDNPITDEFDEILTDENGVCITA